MAMINNQLDVEDLTNDKIQLLTNKLKLRQKLFASGLSKVTSEPLDQATFERLKSKCKKSGIQKFIKPYRGIASFGTCRLTEDLEWHQIENIAREWKSDLVFKAIFADNDPFMVEDYITGTEVSFEVVFAGQQAFILAVHEKIEVNSKTTTTLESACVCPPLSINETNLFIGAEWLKKVLKALDINAGCFHIEAKTHEGNWEIIEINPRIGGALISDSVKYFTKGYSLLEAWLDSLISARDQWQDRNSGIKSLQEKLFNLDVACQGNSPKQLATFFRVYFAGKGRIAKVEQRELAIKPCLTQVFVKEGSSFSSDDKENFVGQALWVQSMADMQENIEALLHQSKSLINIQLTDSTLEAEAIYA